MSYRIRYSSLQGIQAQTVANFYLAFSQNLQIIPVLNKIDLPNANPDDVTMQLVNAFEFDESEVLRVSAWVLILKCFAYHVFTAIFLLS